VLACAAVPKTAAKKTADPSAEPAHGLASLRKGFGKTPEDDILFALGYPHIVIATDDPMPTVTADTMYPKWVRGMTHVPRAFLGRFKEALGCGSDGAGRAKALAKDPPAWTDARIAKDIKSLLEHGDDYELLLLEAMIGSSKLAEATVSVLEGYKVTAWNGAGGVLDTYGGDILKALYFVLLRVPTSQVIELRARLERLFRAGKKYLGGRPIDALDVLLHGREGVERSGYRDSDDELFADLVHADDDPAWVTKTALAQLAKLKAADHASFDLRLAFLGGKKVLAAMRDSSKFPSSERKTQREQLAHVK
jgi:hypothetical protein